MAGVTSLSSFFSYFDNFRLFFVVWINKNKFLFGSFSFNKVNVVNLFHESDTCPLEWTFQQSSIRFFLHDVQISMRRQNKIIVFQWNKESFFLRHVELNSRFIVMTIDEVTLDRPEVGTGFSVICLF